MIKLDNACLNKYHSLQSKCRIDWKKFSRTTVVSLLNCPELNKRKSTTQNFTLNVIKSLSEEAWHAQLITEKQYVGRTLKVPPK